MLNPKQFGNGGRYSGHFVWCLCRCERSESQAAERANDLFIIVDHRQRKSRITGLNVIGTKCIETKNQMTDKGMQDCGYLHFQHAHEYSPGEQNKTEKPMTSPNPLWA